MNAIVRKLRGALGMGLTWSVLWAVIGFTIGVLVQYFDPQSIQPGEEPLRIAGIVGTVGFLSGVFFSGIMAFAERNKSVADLSIIRATVWGVIGGAILPLLTTMNDQVVTTTAPLGALSAAATVAIARWAARRAPAPAPAPEAEQV